MLSDDSPFRNGEEGEESWRTYGPQLINRTLIRIKNALYTMLCNARHPHLKKGGREGGGAETAYRRLKATASVHKTSNEIVV